MLVATADTYRLFANLTSGSLLSYDGRSGTMKMIFDDKRLVQACPNAFWDGTSTNFCLPTAIDDIVAHEWTHAYTQFSDALVYLWQPGALNEAYSDIFGETVDQIDGLGTDTPDVPRQSQQCSNRPNSTLPQLTVVAPAPAATCAADGVPATTVQR